MTPRRFTITWGERTLTCRHDGTFTEPRVRTVAYASVSEVVHDSYDERVFVSIHGRERTVIIYAQSVAEAADIAAELARRMEACR